jgi:predicted dithiol-disulfide oxidoreductase (DUF899 family)
MDDPRVVSRDEWLAARRDLLAQEKEFTRQRDALNTGRRKLPMVEIDKEYNFRGPDGQASLPGLFQGRGQLLIYHFMFDPDWDQGCESCSFLADGIGHLAHLHARDTTLAMVSRAPLAKLEAFRQRMGWTVPWYSSSGSDFNYDFHVTLDPAVAPVQYNYRDLDEPGPDWQGWTRRDARPQRLPAPRQPRLLHLLQLRAGHRHGQQHLPVARPDRPRPAGRLGAATRAQRRSAAELASPPRQIQRVAATHRSRHRVARDRPHLAGARAQNRLFCHARLGEPPARTVARNRQGECARRRRTRFVVNPGLRPPLA